MKHLISRMTLAAVLAASASLAQAAEWTDLKNETISAWNHGTAPSVMCGIYADTYRAYAFAYLDGEISSRELRKERRALPRTRIGRKLDGLLMAAQVEDARMGPIEHEIVINQLHVMLVRDCREKGGYR